MLEPFNVNVYILAECFNKEKKHYLKIDCNGNTLLEETINKNSKKIIKLENKINFKKAGEYKINIEWNGEEAAEKYFRLIKLVIHNQEIKPYSLFYFPIENDYIKNQKNTIENFKKLKNQILNNGNFYGWYGMLSSTFLLGNRRQIENIKRQSTNFINSLMLTEICVGNNSQY